MVKRKSNLRRSFTTRLPASLLRELATVADEDNIAVSVIVERALRTYLEAVKC